MSLAAPDGAHWKKTLKTFFDGMCMGVCDLIPGISGGTIALLMGFYPQLIDGIKSLNFAAFSHLIHCRFQTFLKMTAWRFLLPLLAGILVSMILFVRLLEWILNHEVYRTYLYGAFCGLILASAIVCFRQIHKWNITYVGTLIAGMTLAYQLAPPLPALISLGSSLDIQLPKDFIFKQPHAILNYEHQKHFLLGVSQADAEAMLKKGTVQPTALTFDRRSQAFGELKNFIQASEDIRLNGWLVFSGSLAICAMLLPGISGSYILTILGVYPAVITALADFVRFAQMRVFDAHAFWILCNIALGISLGALLFSRFLSLLLTNYGQIATAFLTGAMLGGMRAIWPFWSYTQVLLPLHLEKGVQIVPKGPLMPGLDAPLFWMTFSIGLTAFLCVYGLERAANQKRGQGNLKSCLSGKSYSR